MYGKHMNIHNKVGFSLPRKLWKTNIDVHGIYNDLQYICKMNNNKK